MKRIIAVLLAAFLAMTMAIPASANPLDALNELLQSIGKTEETAAETENPTQITEDTGDSLDSMSQEELLALLQKLQSMLGETENEETDPAQETPPDGPGESPDGQSGEQPGESAGEPGEGPGGGSGGQETVIEEPDGSGIPKDEPSSTTGDTYGFNGTFDIDTASSEQVNLSEGEWDINDAQMIFWGGSVIQNSGSSSLVVRDSYVRGETAVETAPLAGNPGNLLVAGNIRTTLAMGNSENIYLNSSVISRNWAALSTDAARPATEEGQKELSLYAYGTEAIAMDGGYGAYSDLFCNLYSYGSHIQAAEIGIISGTYGKVTVGTIEDGEKDAAVAAVLGQADKDKRSDKQLQSVIDGGRNALMIHSVNLPPYWEYEGYSKEELPLLSTTVNAHKSTFRTILSLDKGVEYEPQKQAYINHTAGSVILIKSTNADLYLEECEMYPDEGGTGNLIQTVYNNDTMFMNAVPDGETYPGIHVTMDKMKTAGNITHEDYQRDFCLYLVNTTLDSTINEYDCAHWNQVAEEEGFTDYSLDPEYKTHHGVFVALHEGSVWNVLEESHLSKLTIDEGCKVNGIIYVDDVEQPNVPGSTYEGKVVVKPGVPAEEETKEEETTTEEETTKETETEHEHTWGNNGGSPPSCTEDGIKAYICTVCGAEKTEVLPATGHKWELNTIHAATCTDDQEYEYICATCGEKSYVPGADSALGHDWVFNGSTPATCLNWGKDEYICSRCGMTHTDDYAPLGHDWQMTSSTLATCDTWGQDVYTCSRCADVYYEDFAPLGHDWHFQYTVAPTCLLSGYDVYECSRCHLTDYFNDVPAQGHSYTVYPTPGNETMTHTYYCTTCGDTYTELHVTGLAGCPTCGYYGPYGHLHGFRQFLFSGHFHS